MVLLVLPLLILAGFFLAASIDFLLGGGPAATKTLSNSGPVVLSETPGIDFAKPHR
jgi:hypothetical protein